VKRATSGDDRRPSDRWLSSPRQLIAWETSGGHHPLPSHLQGGKWLGVVAMTVRHLLICDIPVFLVLSLLLFVLFALLNLLPTKVNKISKNRKDYIIIRVKIRQ